MIIGIGSDLCDIRRIEQTLEKFGDRFVARCFTEVERRRSDRRAERAASYAKQFAAKMRPTLASSTVSSSRSGLISTIVHDLGGGLHVFADADVALTTMPANGALTVESERDFCAMSARARAASAEP